MRKGKNNRLLKGVLVCETIAIIALLAVLILWIDRPADVAKDQPQDVYKRQHLCLLP